LAGEAAYGKSHDNSQSVLLLLDMEANNWYKTLEQVQNSTSEDDSGEQGT